MVLQHKIQRSVMLQKKKKKKKSLGLVLRGEMLGLYTKGIV